MEGFEFYPRGYRAVYAWLRNENLARIGVNWMGKDFSAVRADIEGHYLKVLDEGTLRLAKRARDSRREEGWTGGSIPDFIRKPYGPSWALVGDAGLHVDPCTVAGKGDTFRDAKLLAEATDEGFSGRRPLNEALAAYERWRGRLMTLAEALDTTRMHRVAGLTDGRTALVTSRPFRAPHQPISDVGLIGGGQIPLPGEVSLAHHGVLFLDELPEFRRHVLEVLRQPLEAASL